jgi:hypothetical protein
MKKYNIQRKPLDEARKGYIERIVKNLEANKFTPDIVNLMQSFVYLILSDDFNDEIIEIRLDIGIPKNGFIKKEDYNEWKTEERLKELYQESKKLIDAKKLCYERQRPIITEIIKSYILLDDFLPQKRASLMSRRFSHHRLVGGWDVPDPVLGKENTKDFDKVFWEVYLHPSDNLTEFKRALQHYYVWMMNFHFKEDFNQRLFEIKNRNVIKNLNPRLKKSVEVSIISEPKKFRITIKFQSYLNTKTKEIIREFDKMRNKLKVFQKEFSHKDNRELMFKRKLEHYSLYLEGKSAPEIEGVLYDKDVLSSYSRKSDAIRTDIKETKRNVATIMSRKLTL